MTDEEIRMQYRFTHHALVGLYKLCRTLGNFKNGVEHNGIDEGEVLARLIAQAGQRVHPAMTGERAGELELAVVEDVARRDRKSVV